MKKKYNVIINTICVIIVITLLKVFVPISLALTSGERIEQLKELDNDNKERLTLPVATIDFVQPYLIGDYSEAEMDEYVKMLKKAGYEAVIIQNIMNIEGGINSEVKVTASWYDSDLIQDKTTLEAYKPTMLDKLVNAIQLNDMKIYIGLASTSEWWNSNFTNEQWRTKNSKFLNDMISEIYQKYGQYGCFEGIYWTNEIYTNADNYYGYWSEMINSNIEYLQKIDNGEKKHTFMLSPFVSQIYDLSNEQVYTDWKKMIEEINFRQGDIICLQDGLGTSSFEPIKVQKYIETIGQAVKSDEKKGVKFWLNVENYEQIEGEGKPCSLERYKLQLSICSKYADGLTSFSYSHYYNPIVADTIYDEQYRKYYDDVIEDAKKTETDDNEKKDNNIIENEIENNVIENNEITNQHNELGTANKLIPQLGENTIIGKIIFTIIIINILFVIFIHNKYKKLF